ncbi:MAG: ATP-binding protein [Candidatus Thermoplasmatota archaeon]|nr:ATP-binding protein [Candidatus Thermoplasmatota archaeon]
MNYTVFINRDREVSFLKEVLSRSSFQLIPVWGRRRIGKTTLLLNSTERKAFYFLATESTSIENLKRFRKELSIYLDDDTVSGLELDWENIIRYISRMDLNIIIDEFPYLISADSSIASVFQRMIDLHLVDTSTKLFLCGSSARMMGSFVLDYKAPLYGRRTGQIKLEPLKFKYLKEFLPEYSFEDLVRVFGMCGGVPLYLKQFDPERDLWENVENVFLDPYSFMYEEEKFLVKQEFKNIAMYRSILDQLTSGRTRIGEIRESLQLRRSDITPYLNNLRAVGFVGRYVPVTEDPSRSRSGIYRIIDHFLRFYYCYIYPRVGLIESGMTEGVLKYIEDQFDTFLGRTFEEISREVFIEWCKHSGYQFEKLGSWWFGENEIDLVGLNRTENKAICIEVKWSRRTRSRKDVEKLMENSRRIRWGNKWTEWTYLYISRGGFSRSCIRWMDEEGIMHWNLKDLEEILWSDKKKIKYR